MYVHCDMLLHSVLISTSKNLLGFLRGDITVCNYKSASLFSAATLMEKLILSEHCLNIEMPLLFLPTEIIRVYFDYSEAMRHKFNELFQTRTKP